MRRDQEESHDNQQAISQVSAMKRTFADADIGEPHLKHFRADDFHVVTGSREEVNTHQPDADSGHGFTKGHAVEFGVFNIATFQEDLTQGIVTGIQGPFVRVGTELYHPSRLRKIVRKPLRYRVVE